MDCNINIYVFQWSQVTCVKVSFDPQSGQDAQWFRTAVLVVKFPVGNVWEHTDLTFCSVGVLLCYAAWLPS